MSSSSKEEGELEEGELPGEVSSVPADDEHRPESAEQTVHRSPENLNHAEPSSSYFDSYDSYTAHHDHYDSRGNSRAYYGAYRERQPGSSAHRPRYSGSEPGRDRYREPSTDDLLHDFGKLIKNTTISDAMRNLDEVCKRLESAIDILYKLWKRSERGGRPTGLSDYATEVGELRRALRSVHVASGTGAGKTQNMESAKSIMKYAWQLREQLFTASQQKELENWISTSKFFKFILSEPEQPEAAAAASTADHDQEQGEIAAPGSQANGSGGRGISSTGQQDVGGSLKRNRQHADTGPLSDADHHSGKQQRNSKPHALAASNGSTADHERDPSISNGTTTPPLSPLPIPNEEELAAVLQTDARDLLRQGKLCLVLDLDHTLLNSVKFSELREETELALQTTLAQQMQYGQQDLYRLPKVGMWTKLRPGIREFLQHASEKFELWIHTNGNRQYANAVVELLDPDQRYFGSRVITGLGNEHPAAAHMTKRLMQGLEGREPVVIIIDDSQAVWPHDLRNLLVVERYLYFPSASKSGSSLFELRRDECPNNGMLRTATRVIDTVHSSVFHILVRPPAPSPPASPSQHPLWDVREVLSGEKRKILAACNIVFTRVIPLGQDPRQHPLWKLAESYGAVCSERVSDTTTHVIAGLPGTEKAAQARAMGKFVVNTNWLSASCILWQRADEKLFLADALHPSAPAVDHP